MSENETFIVLGSKISKFYIYSVKFSSQQITAIREVQNLIDWIHQALMNRNEGLKISYSLKIILIMKILTIQLNNLAAVLTISNTETQLPAASQILIMAEDISNITNILQNVTNSTQWDTRGKLKINNLLINAMLTLLGPAS